jgi:chorismate synthase
VRCLDPAAEREMVARIDAATDAGDTLGGVVELVARGVVVGVGSHVSWDRRLDGRLAAALMALPAVKGVEVGRGFALAALPGSAAHDEIARATGPEATRAGGFARATNRAGGLEGGMTNGEPLVLRVAMKPLSTLMRPLRSVDLATGQPAAAQSERSDVCVVPALGVVGEAAVALTLADGYAEKFGGDSLAEMRRNFDAYVARLGERQAAWEPRAVD